MRTKAATDLLREIEGDFESGYMFQKASSEKRKKKRKRRVKVRGRQAFPVIKRPSGNSEKNKRKLCAYVSSGVAQHSRILLVAGTVPLSSSFICIVSTVK